MVSFSHVSYQAQFQLPFNVNDTDTAVLIGDILKIWAQHNRLHFKKYCESSTKLLFISRNQRLQIVHFTSSFEKINYGGTESKEMLNDKSRRFCAINF